jgi:HEAT repeat protein
VDRDEIMTLVGALADQEPFVRWQAGQSLAALGASASLGPLLQALRTPPVVRQAAAADALGALGDKRAAQPLLDAAGSQHPGLRASAIEALGCTAAADAVPVFLQALRDEQAGVRRAAAQALGKAGDSSTVDALLVRLADDQEHVLVRRSAAWALTLLPLTPSAIQGLLPALEDRDAQVRLYVAEALSRAGVGVLADTVQAALAAHLDDSGQALQGAVNEVVRRALRRVRRRRRWQRLLRRRNP